MNLQHILNVVLFNRVEGSSIAIWIQQSKWAFAVIETIHIMALAILLGSFLIVDLRLLGLGMRSQPVAEVAKLFAPASWVAFAFMVATGIPMFISEAVKLSTSTPFFYKLLFLSLAILFHLTVHKRATRDGTDERALSKVAACLSLTCWLTIALAGRAIAFYR